MIKKESSNVSRLARHARVRKKVSGTPETPRLCVFQKSKAHIRSDHRRHDGYYFSFGIDSGSRAKSKLRRKQGRG